MKKMGKVPFHQNILLDSRYVLNWETQLSSKPFTDQHEKVRSCCNIQIGFYWQQVCDSSTSVVRPVAVLGQNTRTEVTGNSFYIILAEHPPCPMATDALPSQEESQQQTAAQSNTRITKKTDSFCLSDHPDDLIKLQKTKPK